MLNSSDLSELIISTLEDAKAIDITRIDVRALTDITDRMIICHGTSDRHVSALARQVVKALSVAGVSASSVEGDDTGEWILIDFNDALVHIMKREVREYYDLESLWDQRLSRSEASA